MLSIFSHLLGIDLGTANTLVYARGKGIVLNEPSVVAVSNNRKEVLAVGEQAKQMLGRTPGEILAIKPLRDGVIADFDITEIMLKYFVKKAMTKGFNLGATKVVVCVPCGITEVEKRAVEEAIRAAGAREAFLIDEPMAAAMGAGLNVSEPHGCMIVDIGGGTSEVAVISLNGIVYAQSLRVGGNHMDDAIIAYVKNKYNVIIGESTAEYVKMQIGSVLDLGEKKLEIRIRGRSLITGLPESVTINDEEVREALAEPVGKILGAIRVTLENTPPELASDISEAGILLTGGTSKLKGLDKLIAMRTGMPVQRAEDPMVSVAQGAGIAVENMYGIRTRGFTQRIHSV